MSEEGIKTLIIEDDPRIAQINQKFVEKVSGYQVVGVALDEPQAKDLMKILEPDLILLDIYFPDCNGLDLLNFIQQNYKQTDVIMITAAKDIEIVRTALKSGAFDFIIKPIIFDRLKETLIKYKEFHQKLSLLKKQKPFIDQEDIDQLLQNEKKGRTTSGALPKGVDKLTLEKVLVIFEGKGGGFTAEEVGKKIGISRTTSRRYLEYLVSIDQIRADLVYGEIGRPERIYKLNHQ